jgi:hypothetical protein
LIGSPDSDVGSAGSVVVAYGSLVASVTVGCNDVSGVALSRGSDSLLLSLEAQAANNPLIINMHKSIARQRFVGDDRDEDLNIFIWHLKIMVSILSHWTFYHRVQTNKYETLQLC